MPVTGCHSALDAESRFSFFWIPAGVHPREDGGGNDDFLNPDAEHRGII